MNPSHESQSEEILAGFVLGELSEDEVREMGDPANPESARLIRELEKVAAMANLAAASAGDPLPDNLRRIVTATGRALASERTSTTPADLIPSAKYRALRFRESIAWLACLAASLLALATWRGVDPTGLFTQPANETRQALIDSAPDLIQTEWTDGKTPLPGKVIGDVVWSNSAQRGFMRFVGMPVNDPTVEQYQLWIIDPARDDEPIDGGVFNVTSSVESIVPIQAKLAVVDPKAFAITIEKPGGVVVSTQDRLPLLATVR